MASIRLRPSLMVLLQTTGVAPVLDTHGSGAHSLFGTRRTVLDSVMLLNDAARNCIPILCHDYNQTLTRRQCCTTSSSAPRMQRAACVHTIPNCVASAHERPRSTACRPHQPAPPPAQTTCCISQATCARARRCHRQPDTHAWRSRSGASDEVRLGLGRAACARQGLAEGAAGAAARLRGKVERDGHERRPGE